MGFQKLEFFELNEPIRVSETWVAGIYAGRQAAEEKAATLQAQLLQVRAALRRSEQ